MKNCRVCVYIRFFIASVLMILIISVLFTDNLEFFSFVTPWNAVKLIFTLGTLLFLFKLIDYFRKRN